MDNCTVLLIGLSETNTKFVRPTIGILNVREGEIEHFLLQKERHDIVSQGYQVLSGGFDA